MEKPRDMPQGRVTMLADKGNRGLAVLECWPDILEGKVLGTYCKRDLGELAAA